MVQPRSVRCHSFASEAGGSWSTISMRSTERSRIQPRSLRQADFAAGATEYILALTSTARLIVAAAPEAPRYTSGMRLEIRKIAGALGAEVHGVDLSQPLADAQKAELRRAWLEHLVLFFRDQPLAPEQFMAFARAWGEPIEYPFVKGIDGFPQIIEVKKLEHEKVNFGGIWHSDT